MSRLALDLPDSQSLLAQATTENFPVALKLLRPRERGHLLAVYGYARLVDDIGDELDGPPLKRLAALDGVESELAGALRGEESHPVIEAVAKTVRELDLDPKPLLQLIQANRQDQTKATYADFDELLQYCSLSANPVGRLVLGIFGEAGSSKEAASDLICSGLQVVEHLQDVAEDYGSGRVYLPEEDLARFGVPANSLSRRPAGQPVSEAFRRLMAFEVARARKLLTDGARLVGLVGDRRVAFAVAGFAGGGLAQLEAIERAGYDVLSRQVKAANGAILRDAVRLLRRERFGRVRQRGEAAA